MAAFWRGAPSRRAIFVGARHARRPQRCASAGGNRSSGVVRSVGCTFARLGGHSLGAQAIRPPPELDLWREPVRNLRRDRISRTGDRRVGRGIPGLRLQLEQMSRSLRALHANRVGRHQRSGMRSGARQRTRGLGLRLRSAGQLGRPAALLSGPRPIPGDVPRLIGRPDGSLHHLNTRKLRESRPPSHTQHRPHAESITTPALQAVGSAAASAADQGWERPAWPHPPLTLHYASN